MNYYFHPKEWEEFKLAVKECRPAQWGMAVAFDNPDHRAEYFFQDFPDAAEFASALEDYAEEFEKMFPSDGSYSNQDCVRMDFSGILAISHAYLVVSLPPEAKRIVQWFVEYGYFYALVRAAKNFCEISRENRIKEIWK